MSDLKDFVGGQNIDRFLEQLGVEADPQRRALLLRLLIDEQARLSPTREQLDLACHRMTEGAARLARLRVLARCYPPGDRRLEARAMLCGLESAQALMEGHYRRLRAHWAGACVHAAEEGGGEALSSRPSA